MIQNLPINFIAETRLPVKLAQAKPLLDITQVLIDNKNRHTLTQKGHCVLQNIIALLLHIVQVNESGDSPGCAHECVRDTPSCTPFVRPSIFVF